MDLLLKYFPGLTPLQIERFAALYGLYTEWNERINVISRKDIEQLYLHHVLHSLAIAKVCTFDAGAKVLDVGCGGGFPGIPLAIMFPETKFTLVDSIGKKIKVVEAVAAGVGLDNLTALNSRAENVSGRFDYAVSRAVTDMSTFLGWVWPRLERGCHGSMSNGVLYLKGGELAEELALTGRKCDLYDVHEFFPEEFFQTKKVVYIPR